MNTLEHLQRVLPSTGLYVTTIINSHDKDEKPQQRFYSTVDALAKSIAQEEYPGWEIYYGISSFRKKGSRKKDNVHATRVLALDVDCGVSASGKAKPYPTWREGLIALRDFVSVTRLPDPMVVGSGNGLHAYWTLDEDLPPEQWQPLAEALKLATVQHGFKVDPGLTANSALILRPVGTMNYKHDPPSKVRLLIPDNGPYPVAALAAVLPIAPAGPVSLVNGKHAGLSGLAQNLQVYADGSTIAEVVATKCQQIKWGIAHPAEVEEPFWYGMMGVAGSCTEPDATAIEWSKGHPQFNATAAVAKMKQWVKTTTGPASCKKFEDERPNGCKGCPFKGKITTPAQLGAHHQEITILPDGLPVLAAKDIPLPKPFKRTTVGIVQIIDGVELMVCPFNLYPVSYGMDPVLGYEVARFLWERKKDSWSELAVRQSLLNSSELRDFSKAVGDYGMMLLHSAHQLPRLQDMMRSYIVELHRQRALTNLYSAMGWKEDNLQFVIGNKILRRSADSTVDEETTTLTAQVGEMGYGTKGSLKKMVDFTAMLDKLDMQVQMFALCVSLSAPLYKFTGKKAQTVSLYGDTGSGKTLAQLWAQSMWGDPEALHLGAKYTANAFYQRIGATCNLPITVDEFTTRDSAEVGDFLYEVTQGRDKMRLNRRAEATPTLPFAMPIIVSTNMSLSDKLRAASTHSNAQLYRLLEVKVVPNQYLVDHPLLANKIRDAITNNYGYVGYEFLKRLLALGPEIIKRAIDAAMIEFDTVYGASFNGIERFWQNILVLAHLAGKWAAEWGLIKFDYQRGIIWALDQLPGIRHTVASSKRDAFDLITEFLTKHSNSAVHDDMTGGRSVVRFNEQTHDPIRYRVCRGRDKPTNPFDTGVLYFDKKYLCDWITLQGSDVTATMDALKNLITAGWDKEAKVTLGKGTGRSTGAIRIIGIDLKHERLRSILDPSVADDDAPIDRRHLHVV